MSPLPADDDPRDAHLLAALRHAPDRDVAPPPRLTAAILGQARQAARGSGARAWRDGVRAALERLWRPAPMAAFGTLAMATLIGVMWSREELPDATPSLRPERAAEVAKPSGAPPVVIAAAPAPAPQPVKAAPKPAPQAAPAARPLAADAPPTLRAARDDAPREAEPPRDAAVAVLRAPDPAAAPAPATAAAPDAPLQREARAKSISDAAPALARGRSEVTRPALGAVVPAASSPLAAASLEVETALVGDASRLRWRLTSQRLVAHGAAQRDWWQAVAAATEGRWQAATPGADSASVTLVIDGAPRGSLGFEAQGLVWRDANGAAWRAALAPDALRALQEPVARW